jgi:hypothetical protein
MPQLDSLFSADTIGKTSYDPGNVWRTLKPHKPAPSTYASDTYAALTREQWADYVKNYVPLENKLIAYATDPAQPGLAMQKASDNVTQAFDTAQAGTQRQLAGLGVQLSGDEQGAQTRAYGLQRSLADVQAQNTAGALTRARQQSLMGNPAPDVTSQAVQSGV